MASHGVSHGVPLFALQCRERHSGPSDLKIKTMNLKKMFLPQAAAMVAAGLVAIISAGCATHCCFMHHEGSPVAFGTTQDGTPVWLYTLRNKNGMEARIMTYGGIIQSLKVPDKNGKLGDVVLGYDTLDGYLTNSPYFGALIGRYGNRIAKGHFTLDGVTYTLATNNYPNSLHGGVKGFDKVIWQVKRGTSGLGPTLELSYV